MENGKDTKETSHGEGGLPFYPLHLMKEVMVVLFGMSCLLMLAAFFPAHLLGPADPLTTPAHIKPEWYFLSVYQLLKYVPQGDMIGKFTYLNLAVIGQGLVMMVLICVPFLDKYEGKKASRRPLFTLLGIVVVVVVIIMTYLGHFSGEPDPIFNHVFH